MKQNKIKMCSEALIILKIQTKKKMKKQKKIIKKQKYNYTPLYLR